MVHIQTQHSGNHQAGFSLVELIVSLALFTVVVTISVGALLMLIGANDQLQKEQSVMTNLAFALDSMTREIRTGTHYYCSSRPNANAGGPNSLFRDGNNIDTVLSDSDTQDCESGRPADNSGNFHGIAFVEAGESITGAGDRILYYHERDSGQIFRKVGSEDPQSMVSSGIFIEDVEFYVTGSAPLSDAAAQDDQATVTVIIEAREENNPAGKRHFVQTTVTQRTLDI